MKRRKREGCDRSIQAVLRNKRKYANKSYPYHHSDEADVVFRYFE